MGMAIVNVYQRPRVKRVDFASLYHVWRVTWCDEFNRILYRDFYSWRSAIVFATTGEYVYAD